MSNLPVQNPVGGWAAYCREALNARAPSSTSSQKVRNADASR